MATDSPQNLFSPGYPSSYENNLNCTWHLSAEEGFGLELNLKEMEVEECCDTLTVRWQYYFVFFGAYQSRF